MDVHPTYDTLWVACQNEQAWLFRWFECHPGFAGYVQAIGVVLTVAGALVGPVISARWNVFQIRRARIVDFKIFAKAAEEDVRAALGLIEDRMDVASVESGEKIKPEEAGSFGIPIPHRLMGPPMQGRDPDAGVLNEVYDLGARIVAYNNRLQLLRSGLVSEELSALDLLERLRDLKNVATDVRYSILAIDVLK